MKQELTIHYLPQKSFGGKATFERIYHDEWTELKLFSYNTHVASIDAHTNEFTWITPNDNHLSNTTVRHINEFSQQFGPGTMNKRLVIRERDNLEGVK